MPSDVLEQPREGGSVEPPEAPPAAPVFVNSSTSGDELTVSLTHAAPDPLLGEFVTDPPPDEPAPAAVADPDAEGHQRPRADAINALAGLDVKGEDAAALSGRSVSSSEALAALDLTAPAPTRAVAEKAAPRGDA